MPQTTTKKAFALRLDPALHAAVERLAAQELRSVNAELEILLREAMARRGIRIPDGEPVKRGRPKQGAADEHTPDKR